MKGPQHLADRSFIQHTLSDNSFILGKRYKLKSGKPVDFPLKTWRISDSNRSPQTCHACALPDELIPHYLWIANIGGMMIETKKAFGFWYEV